MDFADMADGVGRQHGAQPSHIPAETAGIGAYPFRKELRVIGPQHAAGAAETKAHDDPPPEQKHRVANDDVGRNRNGRGSEGGHHGPPAADPVRKPAEKLKAEKHAEVHDEGKARHGRKAQPPLPGQEGRNPEGGPPVAREIDDADHRSRQRDFGQSPLEDGPDPDFFFSRSAGLDGGRAGFLAIGRHQPQDHQGNGKGERSGGKQPLPLDMQDHPADQGGQHRADGEAAEDE